MSRCRSCGAEILWSKTTNNKNIPIDLEPVLGGNITIEANGVLALVHKPEPDIKRYVSHFKTCPNAKAHRRNG